jgi:hypothetical protein
MAEIYKGAIEQSEDAKKGNYAFSEIVASASVVEWFVKKMPKGFQYVLNSKTWRKFPTRNQDGSGTCVAQTLAKLMGILAYLRWGVFIIFSAAHIYIKRINKTWGDGMGMVSDDAYKIAQNGVTFEELMPSQNMSEEQINALFETELHKMVNMKINNYIYLPVGNLEAVASVIQTTKKGVMTWFRFGRNEWKDVPVILVSDPENNHSVAGVDFSIYENENALIIDESWGDTQGLDGQRVIKESFYKARNIHASYPMDFKFEKDVVPVPPVVSFTKTMVFIELDTKTQEILPQFKAIHEAQKADVIKVQDILKSEGLLPTNIGSTGLYHNLTRKAVKAFQIKYAVASMEELNALDGKQIGIKTLGKLNELYGK